MKGGVIWRLTVSKEFCIWRLKAMNNMFAEKEVTMQERLASTNPVDGISMILLQLFWINCLTDFSSPLLLKCLPSSCLKYAELSMRNSYQSMDCIWENSRS